jgi:hypothetical protein
MSSRYHRFPPRRNGFYASVNFRAANVARNFRIRSECQELRVKTGLSRKAGHAWHAARGPRLAVRIS